MLKFLNDSKPDQADMNRSAYLVLGTEIFFFGFHKNTFEKAIRNHLFCNKTRVNVFLTEADETCVNRLCTMISYLYTNVFHEDSSKINIYFPSNEICKYLNLQEVSCQWYNFFVNLWDEINVDGMDKTIEYMFHQVKPDTMSGQSVKWSNFAVEINIPDQYSLYYCGSDFSDVIHQAYSLDYIYYMVGGENYKSLRDYSRLLKLTDDKKDIRGKFYLIPFDESFSVQVAKQDGFHVVTKGD